MNYQYFQYCRLTCLQAWLDTGLWEYASDMGPVHGHWSAIVRWIGPGLPPGASE